jgi:hypothetical protein
MPVRVAVPEVIVAEPVDPAAVARRRPSDPE